VRVAMVVFLSVVVRLLDRAEPDRPAPASLIYAAGTIAA
jgi:hypothetical protein